MFTLTALHLRFVCEALTPVRLGGERAGSNLRGALGNVMTRANCVGDPHDLAHAATCPVCWLLAANEHPGEERRGYTLLPPLAAPEVIPAGQRFAFGLTLFGSTVRYLPYFILAVPGAGRNGVGPGRGQFALRQVWAVDPLTGAEEPILAEGESWVHLPSHMITAEAVEQAVYALAHELQIRYGAVWRLTLQFLTPMRLIEAGELLRTPDFGVLFARLLDRLDDLNAQFGNGWKRGPQATEDLQLLADRVRLMQSQTRWVEVFSGSARTGRRTPLGGFVGQATYAAPAEVWAPLLPWLIWGQGTQVGKDVVKGNGWYEIVAPGLRRYGRWVTRDSNPGTHEMAIRDKR